MTWFNRTTIKRFGIITSNIFVGITEEVTEVYLNYTSNITANVREVKSINLKEFDDKSLLKLSKKLIFACSRVAGLRRVKSGAIEIISGSLINLFY